MVDSAFNDGRTGQEAYSNMFSSQIGSEEPQIIEEGPTAGEQNKFSESIIANSESFIEQNGIQESKNEKQEVI